MNLSFPAGTILLSNTLPKENQGIAASLVSVSVNYSISIGLGFAGTINRYVKPQADGSVDYLRGFRGAWWFGAGLDGLGLLIALYFVWRTRSKKSKTMNAWVQLKQSRLLGIRAWTGTNDEFRVKRDGGQAMNDHPRPAPHTM